jgi:hypothetical protein
VVRNGGVAEGKLNLFERGASLVGEFGKGTAEVVGSDLGHANLAAISQLR